MLVLSHKILKNVFRMLFASSFYHLFWVSELEVAIIVRRSYRYPNRHELRARTHASSAGTMIPAQQQCTSDLPECNDSDWHVVRVSCPQLSPSSCLLPRWTDITEYLSSFPSDTMYHQDLATNHPISSFSKSSPHFTDARTKKRRSERFFLVSSYIFTV